MFKIYCRIYQGVFRIVSPFLKWREPEILHSYDALVSLLKKKNAKNILIVSDKGLTKLNLYGTLVNALNEQDIHVHLFDDITPNPTITQAENAIKLFNKVKADAVIGFGGGSSLDVAKVVGAKIARPKRPIEKMKGVLKVNRKLPLLIAVPTTSGTGSEATLAAVIIDEKTKTKYAINDPSLFPHYALLLPELTYGLPKNITAETGMDVLTHAVEAYIGKSNTRYTKMKAINATSLVFKYLNKAYLEPKDHEARAKMQIASYDAGVAFTRAYVGNIHALSHALSAYYGLPHGRTNATIMPLVLKAYGKHAYKSLASLARKAGVIEGSDDKDVATRFIKKINELNKAMGIPSSIPEIQEDDIPSLARHAYKEANPLYPVPVIFTKKEFEGLYKMIKGD